MTEALGTKVIERLEEHRHIAHVPTLAGHGMGADKDVTHVQCVQSAIDYIVERHLSDVILVGHSFAGSIICKAVEAMPERVRQRATSILLDVLAIPV